MKRLAIVFIVSVFLFCLVEEVFAGGVYIDFEIPNQKTRMFANEFMSEMQKKKILTSFFIGEYFVSGYLGAMPSKDDGQVKSVIGIFINDQKKAFVKIWCDDLFSMQEIRKKAKEAADNVFQYLKRIDDERKKSVKTSV